MVFNIKKQYELDVKYRRCFAFIPIRIEGNRKIWLRRYERKYRFESDKYNENYFKDINYPKYNFISFGSDLMRSDWHLKEKYLSNERDNYKSDWDNYIKINGHLPK